MLSISMTTMTIVWSRNLIQHVPHVHNHIDCIDSLIKRIQSSTWPFLELTHTNISLVICGFTHHIITPIHSTAVYGSPRHSLHINIWPQSRVFSLLQSWRVLYRPTHHLTAYIMSIGSLEVSSSVYHEFLMGTYYSYVRTLWEPFHALGGDPYHNEECQESQWVLISTFIEL
jgi:hypothetical protein